MKPTSYQLLFINSTRFRESSLSNLVDNIAGEIYKAKYKYGHDDKKYETRGKQLKCLCWNRNSKKKFDKKLKKKNDKKLKKKIC